MEPIIALGAGRSVLLYRWDQAGDAAGVAMSAASIPLEAGLQVSFAAGDYLPGDFWVIPARTAISGETGQIEWPQSGGVPAALPARGIRHHFAPLAIVDYDATAKTFVLLDDCRLPFPSLTDIDAADVGFDDTISDLGAGIATVQQAIDALAARGNDDCTLSLAPGADLQALIGTLKAGVDAKICLGVGTFTLDRPLEISNLGHVLFAGNGLGTKLIAPKGECAVRFSSCTSVTVRDCAFEGQFSSDKADGLQGRAGALSVVATPRVHVSDASFTCAGATVRAASGLSISNTLAAPSRADVHNCTFAVGYMQSGLLIEGMDVVSATGNQIAVAGTLPQTSLELRWRALVRALVGMPTVGEAGKPPAGKPNSVTLGGNTLFIALDAVLGTGVDLQGFLNAQGLPTKVSTRAAKRLFVQSLQARARRIANGLPPATALDRALQRMIQGETVTAAEGIVVAGIRAANVSISGNIIDGAMHGITVAPSKKGMGLATVGRILVEGNTVMLGNASGTMSRAGIMIGSSGSLQINGNRISGPAVASGVPQHGRTEAIRVFGAIGSFAVIRANHATGITTGVTFWPLGFVTPPAKPQWIVTDNMTEKAATSVVTPTSGIRVRLRGVDDNYS